MQPGYKADVRTDLVDGEGNVLSVVIDTNGVSWMLYMEHAQVGKNLAQSQAWWFTARDRAMKEHDEKVEKAVAEGWEKKG